MVASILQRNADKAKNRAGWRKNGGIQDMQ